MRVRTVALILPQLRPAIRDAIASRRKRLQASSRGGFHHRAVAKGSEVSKVGMLTFDTKDEIIISSSGSQFWPQTRRGSRPYPHLFVLHSF